MTLNSRQRRARRQARRPTKEHPPRCQAEATTVKGDRPQKEAATTSRPIAVPEEEPHIQGTPKGRLPVAPPESISPRKLLRIRRTVRAIHHRARRTLFPVPPNADSADFITNQLNGVSRPCHGLIRDGRPDEEVTTFTRKSVRELLPPPDPLSYHEAKKLHVAKFLRDSSKYSGDLRTENRPETLGGSSS